MREREREREGERERAPDFLKTWNSKKKFREALILKPIPSVTPMNLIAAGGQGEKYHQDFKIYYVYIFIRIFLK